MALPGDVRLNEPELPRESGVGTVPGGVGEPPRLNGVTGFAPRAEAGRELNVEGAEARALALWPRAEACPDALLSVETLETREELRAPVEFVVALPPLAATQREEAWLRLDDGAQFIPARAPRVALEQLIERRTAFGRACNALLQV